MSNVIETDHKEDNRYDHLPPVICLNNRPKVEAAQVINKYFN